MQSVTLNENRDFRRAYAKGKSRVHRLLVTYVLKNRLGVNRVGFTATKKIGKAVVRNRCRRRLRAAAALCFGKLALPNADYVLIARYSTAGVDFKELCRDLQYGVKKLNRQLNGETACVQEDDQTPVSVAD
mgnify:FL=1